MPSTPNKPTMTGNVIGSAVLSHETPKPLFRYRLDRSWDDYGPTLVWCGLNPSTADAETDDPTVGRMIEFSQRWGYGSLTLINLFAYRATQPADLETARGCGVDVIGPMTSPHLRAFPDGQPIICCWGSSVPRYWRHRPRAVAMGWLGEGYRLHSLAVNADGNPKHPLYVRGDTDPVSFDPWAMPKHG